MKPSNKYRLGITLMVLSVLFFLFGIYQVIPSLEFSSPCSTFDFAELAAPPEAQIAYCVNNNLTFSGTGFYGNGYSLADEVTMDIFSFRRENQVLLTNGQRLQPQESYRSFAWRLSTNPWLIITKTSEIRNEGVNRSGSDGVLMVIGDVNEGWFPNPLGLVLLMTGIWLYRNGVKDKNLLQQNLVAVHRTG